MNTKDYLLRLIIVVIDYFQTNMVQKFKNKALQKNGLEINFKNNYIFFRNILANTISSCIFAHL